jgi:hypothetical protein
MIDRPTQSLLGLRAPSDAPLPVPLRRGVRVDAIKPAADDGAAWWAAVLALADRMGRARGSLYPSDLRAAAEADGLTPPPGKAASAWWGSVIARLVSMGWAKEFAPRRNPAASRNGAGENFRYVAPRQA